MTGSIWNNTTDLMTNFPAIRHLFMGLFWCATLVWRICPVIHRAVVLYTEALLEVCSRNIFYFPAENATTKGGKFV